MTAVRKVRRHRKPLGFAAAFVTLSAILVFAFASSALIGSSNFEGNDGNLVVNGAGHTDWDNAPNLTSAQDQERSQTDNSFGQGTKEDNVNVTVVSGSIPNSKADLARYATAGEVINGETYLYLAWSRANQSGTVNFDFELNQLAQPDLTTPGAKVLNRMAGDALINYSFQGGSNTPTLTRRSWTGSAWGPEVPISGTCSEGATNSSPVLDTLGGRPPVSRPAQQFGEAAINLVCAGIVQPNACEPFTSSYVKSRSSTAFTSEIKDFVAPIPLNFSNCGRVIIRKQTDPNGATQSFGYHKSFTTQPATGNTFSLQDDGVQNFTGVQQASGLTVSEDPAPPGWDFDHVDCSASTGVSPTINGALVTFAIDNASDILDCTYFNRSRGTIILKKVTDSGNGSFLFTSGTLPGAPFTLTTTGAGEAGSASQTISDLVPGVYDAAEQVPANWHIVGTPSCDDNSSPAAISLQGGETVTCTWHDDRDVGAIDISKLRKHAADGPGDHPQSGVQFQVLLGGNVVGSATTDSSGHACVSGLLVSAFAGDYTVHEILPSGYHGEADKTVTVVTSTGCGDEPNDDADVTFHNTPLTNVTVSIDSQVVGGTASTVDCDNNDLDFSTGAGGDGSQTANNQEPQTIHCTIVVDP